MLSLSQQLITARFAGINHCHRRIDLRKAGLGLVRVFVRPDVVAPSCPWIRSPAEGEDMFGSVGTTVFDQEDWMRWRRRGCGFVLGGVGLLGALLSLGMAGDLVGRQRTIHLPRAVWRRRD